MAPEEKITPSRSAAAPLDAIAALRDLIATLRGEGGCPWDRKQTPESVSPFLVEETYELTSAIASGDTAAVAEELGDVLFQILFMAHLFEERGELELAKVAEGNRAKMMRRHPHVFGDEAIDTAGGVRRRWAEIKAAEKKALGPDDPSPALPAKLPALLKACRYFDRQADKPLPGEPLKATATAVETLDAALRVEDPEAPASSAAASTADQAAGDALLHLVHTILRMNRHPETLLNEALQRQLEASTA